MKPESQIAAFPYGALRLKGGNSRWNHRHQKCACPSNHYAVTVLFGDFHRSPGKNQELVGKFSLYKLQIFRHRFCFNFEAAWRIRIIAAESLVVKIWHGVDSSISQAMLMKMQRFSFSGFEKWSQSLLLKQQCLMQCLWLCHGGYVETINSGIELCSSMRLRGQVSAQKTSLTSRGGQAGEVCVSFLNTRTKEKKWLSVGLCEDFRCLCQSIVFADFLLQTNQTSQQIYFSKWKSYLSIVWY